MYSPIESMFVKTKVKMPIYESGSGGNQYDKVTPEFMEKKGWIGTYEQSLKSFERLEVKRQRKNWKYKEL